MKKPGYNDSCWLVLSFLCLLFPRWIISITLRANGRNSFQWPTTPTMLGITCCVVACFSELLHEVWNWSNWTWAKNSQHFFCCVIRIMLDPLALLFQNCWGHTSASCLCILLSVSSVINSYMMLFNWPFSFHFGACQMFSNKRTARVESKMAAEFCKFKSYWSYPSLNTLHIHTLLGVVASVCTTITIQHLLNQQLLTMLGVVSICTEL